MIHSLVSFTRKSNWVFKDDVRSCPFFSTYHRERKKLAAAAVAATQLSLRIETCFLQTRNPRPILICIGWNERSLKKETCQPYATVSTYECVFIGQEGRIFPGISPTLSSEALKANGTLSLPQWLFSPSPQLLYPVGDRHAFLCATSTYVWMCVCLASTPACQLASCEAIHCWSMILLFQCQNLCHCQDEWTRFHGTSIRSGQLLFTGRRRRPVRCSCVSY